MPTLHQNTRMCLSLLFSRRFSSPLPAAATATDFQMLKCVLDDCKTALDSKAVLETHVKIVKLGFGMDYSLVSHMLLTYIDCGKLDFARRLLDETPCWNADLITGNIMISRFMKNGDVEAAKRVFFNMPLKDVVSWNSLIGGCVKNSRVEEALRMFKDMCLLGVEPDEFTFSSVIAGCARLGALDHALWIHNLLIEKEIALNDILLSAIIDMYAKCGKIEIAKEIFDGCKSSSVSVWNSMITGLAVHGLATDAIYVFSRMEEENIFPDSITFLGILVACSHCGLVELGKKYFDMMNRKYSIEPELEHYGTMVDILGRAGRLDEAYATIRAMSMKPDVVIWKALLSACRTYRNAPLGEIAIRNISSLDGGDYVLLSNTYCSLNKWSSSANMREEMKREGIHKDHGKSWIELAGIIHHFKAGNQAHPEMEAIYKIMKQLIKRAKLGGYVPATDLVLMDVSEEEKEENLIFHSEKLALAFGVLKTSPRTEIRITKNLRTCYDCHSWFKIVSRMLARVIIVRDRVRFHKFEAGSCSCGDYW
ncbi:pentatricopeptide repeat-containing protein At5g50990-like [Chenopodium quinoa]|nr:pentatricopeptide repeat-containing protein At5g50990-like [Chenopodium quinoa]